MLSDPALLAPPPQLGSRPGPRPEFGVVIAAYQAAATIGAALRSVLAQTRPAAEVVVVDDGSTDDLASAVAPFGPAVRLVRIPHGGEPAAKNAGAAQTHSPWIVFLDADDTWAPSRLSRLADLGAARPDLDLLATDAWFVVDGRRAGRFYTPEQPFPVDGQDTEILRRNWLLSSVAVRRTAWEAIRGYALDLPRAGDWHCWIRVLLDGGTAGCVDEPLMDYVIHDDSLSADRSSSLLARVDVLDRVAATHALTPAQRRAWSVMRSESMRRARLARAESALLAGDPSARAACLSYAAAPGLPPRQRATAAAAALVPRAAASRLRRELRVSGGLRSARSVATAPERAAPTGPAADDP